MFIFYDQLINQPIKQSTNIYCFSEKGLRRREERVQILQKSMGQSIILSYVSVERGPRDRREGSDFMIKGSLNRWAPDSEQRYAFSLRKHFHALCRDF